MSELIIGLMSGTSVDGIDAALVEFKSASELKVIATQFTPFPDELRTQINHTALNNSSLRHNQDSPLHHGLAAHYAKASLAIIEQADVHKSEIVAIANHGQTVKHEPNNDPAYSLQLGDGQLIANQTDIPTISQFRQADLAIGGQGAPLMPAFHNTVFARSKSTFILNLGGIANISRLSINEKETPVIGFDTGPSNCLIDQWIELHQNKRYDKDGMWAKSGNVINEVLTQLMQDPYLQAPYPKSTGTDYYNLTWLKTQIPDLAKYAANDIQATLLAFTVQTVKLALNQLNAQQGDVFVCGGGASNPQIMTALQQQLSGFSINKTDALGVPSDWVEATGFAWLGYCHLHNIPSNLPSVTGARDSVVLGEKYLPNE